MLRLLLLVVPLALATACASTEGDSSVPALAAFQAEPIVVHMVIGGVT